MHGASDPLTAHLRAGMRAPFSRATGMDCCLWPCDWILACTGVDPAADMRGAYRNAAGAYRLIKRWGDFETMWRVHMALAGFNTTRRPARGDVGVVRDARGQTVAAIRTGARWAAKAERGLVSEDFHMIVAWSIPHG